MMFQHYLQMFNQQGFQMLMNKDRTLDSNVENLSSFEYDAPSIKTSPKQQIFDVVKCRKTGKQQLPVNQNNNQLQRLLKSKSPNGNCRKVACTSPSAVEFYSQGDLLKTIRQQQSKIVDYRGRLKESRAKMIKINGMLDTYLESNHILAQAYQQKISLFQVWLSNITQESDMAIEDLETRLTSTSHVLTNRRFRIEQLEKAVRSQQESIRKMYFERQEVERSLSPIGKLQVPKVQHKKEYSFGDQYKALCKENKKLQQVIDELNESHREAIDECEKRILEKEQIIRKMSQFNNEMCLTLIKYRDGKKQETELSSFREKLDFDDILLKVQLRTSKEFDLNRARSEKQIDQLKEKLNEEKLVLDHENCFLRRQSTQMTKENQVLREYLQKCNQRIQSLLTTLSQRDRKIDQLLISTSSRSRSDELHEIHSQEYATISCSSQDQVQDEPQGYINQTSPRQHKLTLCFEEKDVESRLHTSDKEALISTARTKEYFSSIRMQEGLMLKFMLQKSKVQTLQKSLKNQKQLSQMLHQRVRSLESMLLQAENLDTTGIFDGNIFRLGQLSGILTTFVKTVEELMVVHSARQEESSERQVPSLNEFHDEISRLCSVLKSQEKAYQGLQRSMINFTMKHAHTRVDEGEASNSKVIRRTVNAQERQSLQQGNGQSNHFDERKTNPRHSLSQREFDFPPQF